MNRLFLLFAAACVGSMGESKGLEIAVGGSQFNDVLPSEGERLFFDSRLSADGKVSCASCHQPDRAFTDGRIVAEGIGGAIGTRNTPSLLDIGDAPFLFWDGRRERLAAQVLDPLLNPREHGFADIDALANAIRERPIAGSAGVPISASSVVVVQQTVHALATYVASLKSAPTALDQHLFEGRTDALTAEQIDGLVLFRGRAGCIQCHRIDKTAAPLTDYLFHDRGIGSEVVHGNLQQLAEQARTLSDKDLSNEIGRRSDLAELGRYLVSKDPKDIGKFKTPSLRNVWLTAPYMHNGSIATLEAAIDHELYYAQISRGGEVGFDKRERHALLVFMQALGGSLAAGTYVHP